MFSRPICSVTRPEPTSCGNSGRRQRITAKTKPTYERNHNARYIFYSLEELITVLFYASCSKLLLFEGFSQDWFNPPFLIFDIQALWRAEM